MTRPEGKFPAALRALFAFWLFAWGLSATPACLNISAPRLAPAAAAKTHSAAPPTHCVAACSRTVYLAATASFETRIQPVYFAVTAHGIQISNRRPATALSARRHSYILPRQSLLLSSGRLRI